MISIQGVLLYFDNQDFIFGVPRNQIGHELTKPLLSADNLGILSQKGCGIFVDAILHEPLRKFPHTGESLYGEQTFEPARSA